MYPDSRAMNWFATPNFHRSTKPAASLLAIAVLLLVGQDVMAAQSTDCPAVLLGRGGNICTASDVSVATAIEGLGANTGSCMPGEQYVVNLDGSLTVRKNNRWDIGIFIASDGKDMNLLPADGGASVCEVAPLPAIDRQRDGAAPGEDPVMGSFDDNGGPDACGDTSGLANGDTVTNFPITSDGGTFDGPVTVTCVAGPNGKVQLQTVVSWNQSDPGACDPTDSSTYYLDQISKCSHTVTELNVEVVGRVTVQKVALNGGLNNFGFNYTNNKQPTADSISNPASPFTLQDGDSVEIYAEIGTGDATVVIDETSLPANWQFGSLSCSGDDVTPVSITGSEATVTLSYDGTDPAASQDDVVCTWTNIEVIPEVTLDKTTSTADYDDINDVIDYSYAVSNTGNVALAFPVTVSDDKATVSCPADDGGAPNNGDAVLDPGESVNCTASYDVNQSDIDAGSVTNTADATVGGVTSNGDSVTVNAVQNPLLSVDKTSPASEIDAPTTVSYSYLVSNGGNVTLTGISLSDNNDDNNLSCPGDTLAPGGSMNCSASRAVSQGEVDAGGSLDNTVTASSNEAPTAQDSLSIPITQSGSLVVVKDGNWNDDGSIAGVAEEGETISYTIGVSNNGNVTLNSVAVTDPLITDPPNSGAISCNSGANPITSLAPGENDICTATYTITAADVTAGSRDNTATATSGGVSDSGSDTVILPDAPGLSLVKAGVFQDDITGDGFAQAGETIAYTFDVTNTGGTAASNVAVADPLITGAPNNGAITCPGGNPIPSLAGGATVQCTASYAVTQANIDQGFVYNMATADSDQTEPTTAEQVVPLAQNVAWTIGKSGVFQDESNDGLAQSGESILYSFTVENTGFVTLTNVSVTDAKVPVIDCAGGNPVPAIAPGASVSCSGSYLVTQVDIDAGQVDNTAIGDTDETESQQTNASTDLPQLAAMTIVKSSATTEITAPVTVLYSYLVSNTGNITLTGIGLSDDNDDDDLSCASDTLAPGTDMSCTASRAVTQGEIDANGSPVADSGVLANTVTGNATELGEAVTAQLEITIGQSYTMTVQKSSPTSLVTAPNPVNYEYLVTNTGNSTLTGITLADNNVDSGVTCDSDTLEPAGSMTCSAVHTVTEQELIDDGSPEEGSGVLYNDVVASSAESEDALGNLSIPLFYVERVLFRVTKDFSDDNPAPVTVQLTCNAGLPLQQSFKLSEGGRVHFTVEEFEPGEMDCYVTELMSVGAGYQSTYLADAAAGQADDVRSEANGCYFDGVSGGIFVCDITNTVGAVAVDVHKQWMIPNEGNEIEQLADITIWCDSEIEGGTLDEASRNYYRTFSGVEGDQVLTAMVIPELPESNCWAVEANLNSAVEASNGCGDSEETAQLTARAGYGDECTIVNTVFFEGIPTLDRWGMVLLALLMLGVGAIGYRRFA